MLISEKDAIEGARIIRPIGKIKAASAWRAVGAAEVSADWRARVLQDLIRRAEDVDADGIIRLDYKVEPIDTQDEGDVALERVYVEGIAVRVARAA